MRLLTSVKDGENREVTEREWSQAEQGVFSLLASVGTAGAHPSH